MRLDGKRDYTASSDCKKIVGVKMDTLQKVDNRLRQVMPIGRRYYTDRVIFNDNPLQAVFMLL
jgi:hypothetical protein